MKFSTQSVLVSLLKTSTRRSECYQSDGKFIELLDYKKKEFFHSFYKKFGISKRSEERFMSKGSAIWSEWINIE